MKNLTKEQRIELESIIENTGWLTESDKSDKNVRLEELTNEMIEILLIDLSEENATKDSQTITFKHYNKDIIAKAIAAARPKYLLEWPADIIRDEVYATVYESMKIVSKDLNMDDINLNNSAFAGPVYNMTMIKIKDKLIPASKRNGRELIEMQEIAASQIGTDEDGNALTIEDILEGADVHVLMGSKAEKMNQFLNWFNSNKKDILTKKQIQFLNNELLEQDKRRQSEMRKRISDRVSKAYKEQYGEVSPRVANLKDQERILEEILESKDFRKTYKNYIDEDFIIDAITEYVSLENLRNFNKGSDNPETIKAMRFALYKKLGEVITLIDSAAN